VLLTDNKYRKKFRILEVSETNVRNYIKETEPKAAFLEKLIEKFEISGEWLLTGVGSFNKETKIKPVDELDVNYKLGVIKNKPHDEQMQMLYDEIEFLKSEINNIRIRDGLYLEAIAAKLGIDVENSNSENMEQEISSSN
jgi:hypothetical protein